MSDQFLIAGNGGQGSVFFSASCKRPQCGRPMTVNGGNRHRFTMRCPCGLRLMVFVADDPNAPILVWRDECPPDMNFNDYLATRPGFRAWKEFHARTPAPSPLGASLPLESVRL